MRKDHGITRTAFLTMLPAGVPLLRTFLRRTLADRHVELRSRTMHVALVAGPGGVWLEHLALKRAGTAAEAEFTKAAFTDNLLQPSGSGSALLPDRMAWQAAYLGPTGTVTSDSSSARISGILVGPKAAPIAREEWTITLHEDVLHWQVEREFLRQVTVRADRFPCLAMQTQAEIPSFLDPEAQLQSPGLFPLETPSVGEMISPNRTQQIHLSPSELMLESTMATGFFSFAKPYDAGTVRVITIGSETVDRQRGPVIRHAGTKQVQQWTLRRRTNVTLVPFQLTLPDAWLTTQTHSFANVHNQWMGWIIKSNPGSFAVLEEMGWFPMMQSIYMAEPTSMHALGRQLEFVATTGVDPSGYVQWRWNNYGYIAYLKDEGATFDQVPNFIVAMHEHAINTGDRAFVRRVMPVLDRVAGYLLAMDRDHDGVFEDANTGLPNGSNSASNWWDIILFGHKDAYTNVYAVAALHAMAEMKAFIGDEAGAHRFRDAYTRSKAAYNTIFWDDERGFYMDWIDVREQMPASGRRYFYTDHNLLAIILGIADQKQAQRILANLDARYEALCQKFHRTRDDIWATPCNMYPVTQLGDMQDNGKLLDQKNYPRYENGGAWFHTSGLEIAARGAAGQTEQAYDAFDRVMRQGYARNRLYGGACLHWQNGELFSEPLNNSLLILWGFAYGCLGVRRTLHGIQAVGQSTHRLEGAKHTFRHLGKNVTVHIRDGRPALA